MNSIKSISITISDLILRKPFYHCPTCDNRPSIMSIPYFYKFGFVNQEMRFYNIHWSI